MRASPILVLTLILGSLGCSGGCSGSSGNSGASTNPSSETPQSGSEAQTDPPVVDRGPPPPVVLRVDVDSHQRHAEVRIENRDDEEVALHSSLRLERRGDGGGWERAQANLALRYDCSAAAPECVPLAPGAVFIPPPWLGLMGDAQCACEECARAETGEYRFVVRGCTRGGDVASPAFTLD